MPDTIPRKTRALLQAHYEEELSAAIAGLKVAQRLVSALSRGQVLVKMEAAPSQEIHAAASRPRCNGDLPSTRRPTA